MKKRIRPLILVVAALVLCFAFSAIAMADEAGTWTWQAPTKALDITNPDGTRNITVAAHRAGCDMAEILGADQSAGGMGGRFAGPILLYATDANVNPDRYLYNFAYLDHKDGTGDGKIAPQEELSQHQYHLIIPGSLTGQFGRTLAGSGPNTVDPTISAEYGGVCGTIYQRADIITGSTAANYEEQVDLVNSLSVHSEFYQEGDKEYDPLFVEIGTGTFTQRIQAFKDVAAAMNQVIKASDGKIVARYGDPEVIAENIDKTVWGTYFYLLKQIEQGNIDKKSGVWVYQKSGDEYICNYAWMEISAEFFGDLMDHPEYYKDCSYKYTLAELAEFDFILLNANRACKKADLLKAFADAGYADDEIPLIMVDCFCEGWLGGWGWGGAGTSMVLAAPYTWLYAYYEELAELNEYANPAAMFQYILQEFAHISTEGDTLSNVTAAILGNMWNKAYDNDRVPEKTNFLYDPAQLEAMITEGLNYAVANEKMVKGQYESYWDPIWQCETYEEYLELYTSVDGKGCFVSAGVLAEGTALDGYYVRTGGDAVKNYTYAKAEGVADGKTVYYENYVTEDVFNAYKEGAKDYRYVPDMTSGIGAASNIENFADVPANEWFYSSVEYVLENNLMYGAAEGFNPLTAATRAEIACVMYRLAGSPVVSGTASFTDIAGCSVYEQKAIKWCEDNKIMSGIGNGKFDPSAALSREQQVAVFYNYCALNNIDLSASADLTKYADADKVGSWAAVPMKWAFAIGLIKGTTDTTLAPQDDVNRAMLATFVTRIEGIVK